MINAFKKSKIICWSVRIIAAAVIAFLWYYDTRRGAPVYIPVIATVLTVGVGYFLSRLLGNLSASTQNTKLLGLLHMELDPERFIEAYKEVPEKIPKTRRDHAVTASYLADGYMAAGQPEKALSTLEKGFEGRDITKDLPLQGLYHGNRLGYLVDAKEMGAAKEEAEKVDQIVNQSAASNRALSENLRSALLLRRARIGISEGEVIDRTWLEGMLSNATYNLRRLELYLTLAENAKLKGDAKTAETYFKKMAEEGGKTWYTKYAEEMLEEK